MTGNIHEKDWQTQAQKVDFFHLKGILENLFDSLALTDRIRYQKTAALKEMHPGRTAMILLDDQEIGFLGQVHPSIAKDYEVSETYVAELNLDQLLAAKTEQLVYQPVSKFPSVTRDMALLLDETIDNQSVMEINQAIAKITRNLEEKVQAEIR